MNLMIWTENRESGLSLMDHLFDRLDGMYPGAWRNKFPSQVAKDNWKSAWSEAFHEDGIRPEEIASALRVLRRPGGFPPSLPEFLAACRQPVDYDKAFFEAVHQMGIRRRPKPVVINGDIVYLFDKDSWTNPAIYWAAIAMGKDLDLEFQKVRNRWHWELDNVLQAPVKPVPQNTNLLSTQEPSKHLTPEEEKNVANMFKKILEMLEEQPEEKPQELNNGSVNN